MTLEESKALVPIEEKQVDFYGDELTAVRTTDGRVYVPVRPICRLLGVAWTAQRQRILRDPVLSPAMIPVIVTITGTGQQVESLSLPLELLPGWLFGLTASRVQPELQEKIVRYRRECFRVLWEAFQTGRLTSPDVADAEEGESPAAVAYRVAKAVMELARSQLVLEAQVADHSQRLERLEAQLSDSGRHITDDQASQLSQAIKAVALKLSEKTGRNEYGGVYGELYRRFAITSYKLLSARRFPAAITWLSEWYQNVTGSQDVPF